MKIPVTRPAPGILSIWNGYQPFTSTLEYLESRLHGDGDSFEDYASWVLERINRGV